MNRTSRTNVSDPHTNERRGPLIELRHVSKVFAGEGTSVPVLQDVSLNIESGEFVAIIGASGSGKSTLMNILGCLDRPSSGSYRCAGREVSACDADELALLRRELFGFVFQQYHLVKDLTAADNVAVPAVYRGLSKSDRQARAEQLLGSLGLTQRQSHRPQQLSGGQQQRVSIARALMNGGPVLLADEPTGALDSASGLEVMNLLQQLSAAGHTIVLVTHDRAVAQQARRVIEISDGRIVADSGRDREAVAQLEDSAQLNAGERRAGLGAGVFEAARAAFRALRVNLGRTMLTLLGVVVGVAAVVALLAVGEGSKAAVVAELDAFGTNRLYISPVEDSENGLSGGLTVADVDVVKRTSRVLEAMPLYSATVLVRAGKAQRRTNSYAASHNFPTLLNWRMESGRFFSAAEEREYATVALLGKKLAKLLFPHAVDPRGQTVIVDNVPFQVLGVLESKGALVGNSDEDDVVVMPYTTGSTRVFGTPFLSWISVSMVDAEHSQQTVDAITANLTRVHRIKDFSVYNRAAFVAAAKSTRETMTSLLTATAIIALVVGGIGVMNVMLMTVSERTSEIGIRMAVGAKRRDVLAQFLTEAVVLSSIGGVVGLILGLAVGLAARGMGQKVIFTAEASVLAFVCAALTGLLCGYLPARRAASLDPVAALARR